MTTEQQLAETLHNVAQHTHVTPDWDAVVRDADQTPERPASRFFAVAAALLIVLGLGSVAVLSGGSETTTTAVGTSPYLLPGETIVGLDPLVVLPPPIPVAAFDTGSLGIQIKVEPARELDDEARALITQNVDVWQGRTLTKVTLLGRVDGRTYIDVVFDGPDPHPVPGADPEANYRERYVLGEVGGRGYGAPAPVDSDELLANNATPSTSGPAYTAPTGGLIWSVRPNTAVVALASPDENLWTVPTGGHAIIPIDLADGERFVLEALDVNGNVIDRYIETVDLTSEPRIVDDADSANPVPVDAALVAFKRTSAGDSPTIAEWVASGEREIMVWMLTGATDEQRAAVEAFVAQSAFIDSGRFVTNEEVLVEFQVYWADEPEIANAVGLEDLPSRFDLTLGANTSGEDEALLAQLANLPGVNDLGYLGAAD